MTRLQLEIKKELAHYVVTRKINQMTKLMMMSRPLQRALAKK